MKSKTPLLLFAIGYLTITGLLIDGFLTNQPKPLIILFIFLFVIIPDIFITRQAMIMVKHGVLCARLILQLSVL